jgi:chromosomal replication initiator protein
MADAVVSIPLAGQPFAVSVQAERGPGRPLALDRFLAGPENQLVEPVVRQLLGGKSGIFNPLVLYGPSGTGKSHLALGLATAWRASLPGRKVIHLPADDFAHDLANAIEMQAVDDLRTLLRSASLLVVEDLGRLLDKPAAQEELLHTLDAVVRCGGQVVITAHAAPVNLRGLLPGLQSRLVAGLCLPLSLPGPTARLEILKRLAALREVELAEPAARLLAEGLNGSVPELMGALVQLEVPARQEECSIDAPAIRKFLGQRDARRPQITRITSLTARHFSIPVKELRGPSRRRAVVHARDVAMHLSRLLTGHSLEQIGRYFGGRDHTTVMHGCQKAAELAKTDSAIRHTVELLCQQIELVSGTNVNRAKTVG